MIRTGFLATTAGLWLSASMVVSADVDFGRDIAPLLAKNCVACHNTKTAEGGLNLESHTALMAGGDSGDSIVAGDIEASYLFARVSGAEEPLMPPEDNAVGAEPFSEKELELLRTWIGAGAMAGEAMAAVNLQWSPLPTNLQPVYALDTSPDGQYLAFGRGSSLLIAPTEETEAETQRLVDPSLPQPDAAHLDIVQSVAFSPDSQRLATGGFRTVKVWKRATRPTTLLQGLSHPISLATLSTDGQLLAGVSAPTVIEITNIASGLSQRFLKSHSAAIAAVAWLGDSHLLLSCDDAGNWVRTDANTGETTRLELQTDWTARQLVALSSEQLLAVDAQGRVFSLSLTADEPAIEGISQLANIAHLAILPPTFAHVLAVAGDGHATVMDLATGTVQSEFELGPNLAELSVDSSGLQLAIRRNQGPIEVWNLASGEQTALLDEDYRIRQQVHTANRQVVRQQNRIQGLNAQVPELKKAAEKEAAAKQKVVEARQQAADALAKEEQAVAAAQQAVTEAEQAAAQAKAAVEAANKQAAEMLAQVEAKKKAAMEAATKRDAAQTQLGKRDQALATANESAERAAAAVPELESKIAEEQERLSGLETSLQTLQSQLTPAEPVTVAFSGDRLAVASRDSVIRVYTSSGEPLANLPTEAVATALRPQREPSGLLALTDRGSLLACDLRFGWKLERTLGSDRSSPFSDRVTALDFSPDGKQLAIGSGPPSRSGEVRVLDLETGELQDSFGEIHSDTVLAVRFSPDGRLLATGSADKLCKLFDVEQGKLLRSFEGHTHHVLDIAWRDDGEQLATASADATVKLWKVANASQDRTISGFKKEATSLAYIGQSHQLIVTAADGSVRLVNADDGKILKQFAGAEDALFRVATLSAGERISAGGQAGRIWTWQIEDAKLMRTLPAPSP